MVSPACEQRESPGQRLAVAQETGAEKIQRQTHQELAVRNKEQKRRARKHPGDGLEGDGQPEEVQEADWYAGDGSKQR